MTLFSATITLLLIMDPLGNIPIFLSVLSSVEEHKRSWIIIRESIIAFLILCLFLFAGESILAGFHISEPALTIAGGIILFLLSIKMVFPSQVNEHLTESTLGEPFIVPLAMPLLAGPSAIAIVLLFATQEPEQMSLWVLAIALSCLISMLTLMVSNPLRRLLGEKGLVAMERLMGMLLIALSVQMFLNGISEFFGLGKIA